MTKYTLESILIHLLYLYNNGKGSTFICYNLRDCNSLSYAEIHGITDVIHYCLGDHLTLNSYVRGRYGDKPMGPRELRINYLQRCLDTLNGVPVEPSDFYPPVITLIAVANRIRIRYSKNA